MCGSHIITATISDDFTGTRSTSKLAWVQIILWYAYLSLLLHTEGSFLVQLECDNGVDIILPSLFLQTCGSEIRRALKSLRLLLFITLCMTPILFCAFS